MSVLRVICGKCTYDVTMRKPPLNRHADFCIGIFTVSATFMQPSLPFLFILLRVILLAIYSVKIFSTLNIVNEWINAGNMLYTVVPFVSNLNMELEH